MCKQLRIEAGTTAELYQPSQIPFAGDPLTKHRSRLPSNLQIDNTIVPIGGVRPELSLFVRHCCYALTGSCVAAERVDVKCAKASLSPRRLGVIRCWFLCLVLINAVIKVARTKEVVTQDLESVGVELYVVHR